MSEVVSELIKTNIFSLPAAPFVAIICLSCVFWLWHKGNSDNRFHRVLGIALGLATLSYLYLLLNENIVFQLPGVNTLTLVGMATLSFVLIFLFSLLYVSYFLLSQGQTPFLFFNSINAIGAQLMLLVVDARFAATYKVMFPSLLLLSVFIFYSIATFRKNLLFLVLALGIITLIPLSSFLFSLYYNLISRYSELLSLIILAIILVIIFAIIRLMSLLGFSTPLRKISNPALYSQWKRKVPYVLGVLFILSTLAIFSRTLIGYYLVSIPQNYNLQAIASYHEKGRVGELVFKKVPFSNYGYHLSIWQTMPYYLKECYKIKEDTPIRYLE